MKATGIVRRLDDLGRLVIPKEIRKQYRLKEGDSIEFFTENDRILIQKFDIMSKNIEEISIMCETLQAMYQNTVLFIQEEWLQRNHYHLQEEFVRLTHVPVSYTHLQFTYSVFTGYRWDRNISIYPYRNDRYRSSIV